MKKKKSGSIFAGLKNVFSDKSSTSKKVKYVVASVLFVVVLVIFFSSTSNPSSTKSVVRESSVMSYAERTEERLQKLLCTVRGIGDVRAFVYVSSSEEVVYKEDTDTQTNGTTSSTKTTTVFDKNGNLTEAVVVVTKYPKIEGILIVAGGAGDVKLKLKIIDAVSCLFSIAPSKIEVLEGKS